MSNPTEHARLKTLLLPDPPPFPAITTLLAEDDAMFEGDSAHYVQVGRSAIALIERALDGRRPRRILDLPCGHGRVTRMLRARFPSAAITVCDLDRGAVDFSAATFGARGAYSREDFSALSLGRFDLVWVGSLITHLAEPQTRRFFDFAARQLTPDGVLVVTSHGDYVAQRLRSYPYGLTEAAARGLLAQARMQGYGYRNYPGGDGYGISLIAQGWFRALFADGPLSLVSYWPRAWDHHQDVLVLRPRRRPWWHWLRRPARPWRYENDAARPLAADLQEAIDQREVPGFDERWYLGHQPDVAAAVADGRFSSGLDHYRRFGWREGRPFRDPAGTFGHRVTAGITPEERLNLINEVWAESAEDREREQGWYWLRHPLVQARVNRLASGDPAVDAYGRLSQWLGEGGSPLPAPRALSLGCGFGGLERDLIRRGLALRIDGYDLAEGAITGARREAAAQGLRGLHYHVADLETAGLPPASVDLVFGHQSIHHVERLEQLFEQIRRALRPGGVFHLHEFVGPNRFQWTDPQIDLINRWLERLPAALRRLPSGEPKPPQRRPTIAEMIAADPSEAIRSAEIEAVLGRYFTVVERRPLGGALAHLALAGIAQNFSPDDPEHRAAIERLFEMEDEAMAEGAIGSDFMVLTALRA